MGSSTPGYKPLCNFLSLTMSNYTGFILLASGGKLPLLHWTPLYRAKCTNINQIIPKVAILKISHTDYAWLSRYVWHAARRDLAWPRIAWKQTQRDPHKPPLFLRIYSDRCFISSFTASAFVYVFVNAKLKFCSLTINCLKKAASFYVKILKKYPV